MGLGRFPHLDGLQHADIGYSWFYDYRISSRDAQEFWSGRAGSRKRRIRLLVESEQKFWEHRAGLVRNALYDAR
jgi:hypothetical protein